MRFYELLLISMSLLHETSRRGRRAPSSPVCTSGRKKAAGHVLFFLHCKYGPYMRICAKQDWEIGRVGKRRSTGLCLLVLFFPFYSSSKQQASGSMKSCLV
jgi:hypothetical protein